MQLSRRRFLESAGLVFAVPRLASAQEATDGFQLLRAEVKSIFLLENQAFSTTTWQFSGESATTVLRGRQGEEIKVHIVNLLDREIWFHWFGVRGPSELMTLNIQPGAENAVDCVFTPPDAGTFWFGPLTDASRLRDMGLYGMLVIEEKELTTTFFDVPMIIDDWKIDADGMIVGDFGNLEAAVGGGRLGNWFTVNSLYKPRMKLPADRPCRLRLLNTANAREMNVQFKGADPLIVALDGQPISPRHVGRQVLALAAGQRADLVLDTGSENVSMALDLFEDIVEVCYLDREGSAADSVLAYNFALPPNPVTGAINSKNARAIPIVIAGGAKGGLKSARFNNEVLDTRALLERGVAWAINETAGPGSAPIAQFAKDETVIFEIENRTYFEQPLHIHGHVWQLVEADGMPQENQPWMDTVVVPARKTLKLAFVADNPGLWVLQSLVAERVDSGLIASFSVATA